MSRYFTRPAKSALYVEDESYSPDPTFEPHISVPDHVATDTGLLDARGERIWRSPRPVGFGRTDEW